MSRFSSRKYEESWEKANEWLESRAPDFVNECILEMASYIKHLKGTIKNRDDFIKMICEEQGVDHRDILGDHSDDIYN